MAHEAFALSPISARAAQSGETDYEAIREAFMETARGRWFLGEYAKRNRHADTRLVLNAVARIERMLQAAQQPPPGTRLPEILAILSNTVDQAAEAAASAVEGLAIEERLAPIRKGARILKKISWRWREIGTESRTCDSIDSQVDAIQESCRQLAGIDIGAALAGAFELIRTRLEALAEDDGNAAPPADDAVTKPRSAAAAAQGATEDDTLAHAIMAAPDAAASSQEAYVTAVLDIVLTPSERAETASVQHEAKPSVVAIEIATPTGMNGHSRGDAADRDRVEPARSKPMVVADQVEPTPTQAGGHVVRPWMQPEPAAATLLQLHPSLGSTPFTNEFLEQRPPDPGPFPAIRRMSLTEKIEFFS
jgi:hypothetical protein